MKLTDLIHVKVRKRFSRVVFVGLLLICNIWVSAQHQPVILSGNNLTLKDAFKQIEQQTNLFVDYNVSVLDGAKVIGKLPKQGSVKIVLEQLLKGLNCSFSFNNNHVIIVENKSGTSQKRTIKGIVKDGTGLPVIGANVVEKDTQNGTITGVDGSFVLQVGENAVLNISFIGFLDKTVTVRDNSAIDVILMEDTQKLDEIVVVGYGTQRKRDLTGAIASVSAKKITEQATTNAVQALQGKIAGVNITQDNWNPGASGSIQIRGRRSLSASNDPLYVIDGIPIDRGINEINPSEIESIEVLKDASATAIYGSRGANGVVLITTKRGKAGKTRIEYDGYYGIQKPLRNLDIMNGAEFAEFVREAYRNKPSNQYGSITPDQSEDQKNGIFGKDPYVMESVMMGYDENGNYNPSNVRSFDWVDAVMRTGNIQNHQLTVTGGSEKTKVMFSGAYFSNEGIMKDKDYERFSIRTNVDHEVNSFLTLGTSTMYSRVIENSSGNLYERARNMSPLASPYNEDGTLTMYPGGDGLAINPVAEISGRQTENRRNRLLSNVYAEVKLPLNFKYRFNFGLDHRTARDGKFRSNMALGGSLPEAEYGGNSLDLYTFNNILYYDNVFKEKHRLNVTLLQEAQDFHFEEYNINVKGLPAEYQEYYNVGAASEVRGVSSKLTTWRMLSFMGRINYGLMDRYLLTLSGRYDGSSVLADGHKYQFFPSASFAWRMKEEAFLKPVNFLDDLKLRIGYGKTGNSAVSPYQTQGSLALNRYVWDESLQISYAPNSMPNSLLSWETTGQVNVGLDFSFFNYRLSGAIDVYSQHTYDLLMPRNLPVVSGFNSVLQNIGKTKNTGLEISLNAKLIDNQDFKWNVDLMFYTNKEQIVELYGKKQDDIGSKWFIGQPIDIHYDYEFDGIWQDTPEDRAEMEKFNANGASYELGLIRPKDQNGDYKINAEDRVILGTRQPDWIGGLTSYMEYKGIDLSFQLYANVGAMAYNDMVLRMEGRWNSVKVDYWTPTNPSTTYPKPSANWETPPYINTVYYEKASYLRVKYITLGYSFPKDLLSHIFLEKARVYATVQNPFLWTKFRGLDPEGGAGYNTPSPTTFMVGLNLSF
ncbi:TonB-dependent receptor [Parabacteroides sp. GYB001]|uniref:SusC/RagA family TonB-linked outer membrane protein n=1 Tax=Parabacteroides leei TaxID=2939491 RepID=UPI002016A8F1|nr:TonB-dependent receptor [Parabacteroides leei]MCL3852642.1 TonB-dependent receptor [Parabacteroides leei]